jgi:hypothetical protein
MSILLSGQENIRTRLFRQVDMFHHALTPLLDEGVNVQGLILPITLYQREARKDWN